MRERDDEPEFEPNRRKKLGANKVNSGKKKRGIGAAQVAHKHRKRGPR